MTSSPPRLELYLRSLAPTTARGEQERIVERLESLDGAGRIRGYDVALCGDCVCPSTATAKTMLGQRLLSRYESFERWAAERDRELVGFEERNTTSLLTGTEVTGIVFPRVTLAEYTNGDLSFVAPSRNGSETTSVLDWIERY